jgi:hypothetical protein
MIGNGGPPPPFRPPPISAKGEPARATTRSHGHSRPGPTGIVGRRLHPPRSRWPELISNRCSADKAIAAGTASAALGAATEGIIYATTGPMRATLRVPVAGGNPVTLAAGPSGGLSAFGVPEATIASLRVW